MTKSSMAALAMAVLAAAGVGLVLGVDRLVAPTAPAGTRVVAVGAVVLAWLALGGLVGVLLAATRDILALQRRNRDALHLLATRQGEALDRLASRQADLGRAVSDLRGLALRHQRGLEAREASERSAADQRADLGRALDALAHRLDGMEAALEQAALDAARGQVLHAARLDEVLDQLANGTAAPATAGRTGARRADRERERGAREVTAATGSEPPGDAAG